MQLRIDPNNHNRLIDIDLAENLITNIGLQNLHVSDEKIRLLWQHTDNLDVIFLLRLEARRRNLNLPIRADLEFNHDQGSWGLGESVMNANPEEIFLVFFLLATQKNMMRCTEIL